MSKRDVYARLIDLEAVVERQRRRIAQLESRIAELEAQEPLAQAHMSADALDRYLKRVQALEGKG